jgi:hypothetical protein
MTAPITNWPDKASNPIGTFTVFDTVMATANEMHTYRDKPWADIVRRVANPTIAKSKSALKLISLAEYGDKLTPKGCIRSAANVRWVYGIEIDYDLEVMPMATAAELLQGAKLEAVFYTSPSHKPDKPRWRILLPTGAPMKPEARRDLVGRINRLLGGVVSHETFTLSQSFYVGQVEGAPYECLVTHGRTVDQLDVPPLYPVGDHTTGEAPVDETTDAELRASFIKGTDRYRAMLKLSSRWAARGMAQDDMIATMEALFDEAKVSTKNKDGINLRARIRTVCESAWKKYGESRAKPDAPEAVTTAAEFEQGPPCLQTLAEIGFPSGVHKDSLFQIAVYLKKRYPDDWESYLNVYNVRFFKPPLSGEQQAGIVKSLNRKEYNFSCSKQPICAHCNKQLCRTRLFGVGQEEWNIAIDPGSVIKVLTDPPYWIIGIRGRRIMMTGEDLMSQVLFGKKCMDNIDYFPGKLSAGRWREQINDILRTATPVEASPEASASGELEYYLQQFCTVQAQAETREEIITGKPFTEDGMTYFRSTDFKKYLEAQHFRALTGPRLYSHLRTVGLDHKQLRVGDNIIRVWFIKEFKQSPVDIPPRSVKGEEGGM